MATLLKTSREYVDFDFTFTKHPITNNVSVKKNINAVKQSITHLMTLKEGDKPFHPEIKSPIYQYLFENASMITQIVLEDEVQRYLTTYEPRMKIIKVTISFPNPNAISCDVYGEIINITEPFTVNVLINRLR